MSNTRLAARAARIARMEVQARVLANYNRKPKAIFNLNRVGPPTYVIRDADAFPGENRMISGPFNPAK